MDSYNGYSRKERERRAAHVFAAKRHWRRPRLPAQCAVTLNRHATSTCGGLLAPIHLASPASYPLCIPCHKRLHNRFVNKPRWYAYLEFLSQGLVWPRGIYQTSRPAYGQRREHNWPSLSHLVAQRVDNWWARLTTDESSKTSPAARPRLDIVPPRRRSRKALPKPPAIHRLTPDAGTHPSTQPRTRTYSPSHSAPPCIPGQKRVASCQFHLKELRARQYSAEPIDTERSCSSSSAS